MSAPAGTIETTARAEVNGSREFGLDILRIVSICGVVAIHVFGYLIGRAPQGSLSWLAAAIIDIGFVWVVPVFVMISGALILGSRMLTESPVRFYRRRASRLVPPIIAWHLIYLIGVRLWMRGEELPLPRILQLMVDGSVFTQLYFLWLIAGLYLVAPVLAAFLQGGGRGRAAIAAALFLTAALAYYSIPGLLSLVDISRPIRLNLLTHWLPYVGYFIAGYALRGVRLSGIGLAAATFATMCLIVQLIWQYVHKGQFPAMDAVLPVSYVGLGVALTAVGTFIVTLSLAAKLAPVRTAGPIVALSNAAFGVFLVHLAVFEAIRLNWPEVSVGKSFPVIFLAFAVTLTCSFGISLLARKVPVLRRIF
jgi:surface polysaccharide O-acyltransferase-like enzyme